jgi:lipoprotein-releasing system permease protein
MSFSFSIAVILCTFGLMDGFDYSLKTGLRYSSSDLIISSRKGFFQPSSQLDEVINSISPQSQSYQIQTEAFALANEISKGVLVRGIQANDFREATGLKIILGDGKIAIGKELAKQLQVKIGDQIALTFGRGNQALSGLPVVRAFEISSFVSHGIYQKDLRFVYIDRKTMSDILDLGKNVNQLLVSVSNSNINNLDQIEFFVKKLRSRLPEEFIVKPFWNEFGYLIEAVKVEKVSISIILQLIVVIAVFNIAAFVIYIMEKKSQDFFFLRAVGLSLKQLMIFWLISIIAIWMAACSLAFFMAQFFNWSLANFSFLQIPGEIYVLSGLQIRLDVKAYLTVYLLSLIWVFLAGLFGYWRMKKRSILQGLREEFN